MAHKETHDDDESSSGVVGIIEVRASTVHHDGRQGDEVNVKLSGDVQRSGDLIQQMITHRLSANGVRRRRIN